VPARFDSVRFDAATRTPSGALRVPAVLTRPGVFEYTDAAGRTIREWRPEEEVHRADALASLEDAPVVMGKHPRAGVDPNSYGALTVGHVRAGRVAKDPKTGGVASELQVGRADAIAAITARRVGDISCGYDVRVEQTAGVVPEGRVDSGKPYDRIQRDMVYNHVLILEPGGGRAGRECSLRLDSADNQLFDTSQGPETMKLSLAVAKFLKAQGRADAADQTVDGDEAAVQAAVTGALKSAGEALDAALARADAAEAKLAAIDVANAKAAREALVAKARTVLGKEWKADAADGKPLTDRAVKELVIAKVLPSMRLDATKADAYVDATFELAFAPATSANNGATLVEALNAGGGRADSHQVALPAAGTDPRTIADPIVRARFLQAHS
jgi:hypothetical protein